MTTIARRSICRRTRPALYRALKLFSSYINGPSMQYRRRLAPGDAVLFHCFTVHAAGTNRSRDTRHALFYSYRPGWARPSGRVDEWHPGFVRRAPPLRRRLLLDLNGGLGPRPAQPHD